ncbi:MAG: hypothetical protein B7Y99_09310 [Caulobacterales bacterium 32-69-10]|nr:MAG: hypothetical protein B7Y99_09310 [Caulobacterales bacterium 32-69-10]
MRCAGCGASWRAEAVRAEPPPLELIPEPAPAPPPEVSKPAGSELPKTFRAKTEAVRRTRHAAVAGAVWGVMGVAVIALMAGAALFRVDVVRLWPRTAGAYAKVGMPVNPTGLAPENVLAGPGLKNGHAAVVVTGMVRNVETRSNDPAPIRVALLDKGGKTLVTQVVNLPPGRLQPGQTRPFSTAFLDPPSAAANVQVEFVLGAPPPAHRADPHGKGAKDHGKGGDDHGKADEHGEAHVAEADMAHLRGPAEPALPAPPTPKHAAPLPADSPYALPVAAEANTHHPHEG